MQVKLNRIRKLSTRFNRKRPLAALTWTLAPGLKIGVQVCIAPAKCVWQCCFYVHPQCTRRRAVVLMLPLYGTARLTSRAWPSSRRNL